ncbi:MAG TPA: hypothetical protein VJ828_05365 [Lacipirellulaceae bacterium]|nr:hypothetical protein [Lacipirellulaceae bacterium]
MSLSFFLVLFTYLAVAAASVRANNVLSAGLISTFSLGIILFSGVVAWNYGRRRPFWIGFFVFFTASYVLYFWGAQRQFYFYNSLSSAFGVVIEATLASKPIDLESPYREYQHYTHAANCFITTAFGVIGGLLTAKALRQDIDDASRRR